MKNLSTIFLSFLIFSFSVTCVSGAFEMNITSLNPISVNSSESEVKVTASISGLPSESYFRVAWQEGSGKQYFGYMKNNLGDWVKIDTSQDCKNYFKISDTATTSAVFTTKIGDDNLTSNGTFGIKLRRYTASCASYSDSESSPIQINIPTPSPSPTPAPSASPTAIATPSPSPTKSSTSKPTTTPEPQILGSEVTSPPETQIPTPTPKETAKASGNHLPLVGSVFTGMGIIFIGVAGYFGYRKQKGDPPDIIIE